MKILLTGASGFIGRHVVGYLLEKNRETTALIRNRADFPSGVKTRVCDLLDKNAVHRVINEERPSHILHLAWAGGRDYLTSPENIRWTDATFALARAFSEKGGKRFVGVGTCVEYAPVSTARDERATPTLPDTLYGKAKLACCNTLSALSAARGFSFAWCRLFYIFGPGEQPGRLIPSAYSAMTRGRPFRPNEGGRRLDYMDVRDVARACVTVLESGFEGPINIAAGSAREINDILAILADILAYPRPPESIGSETNSRSGIGYPDIIAETALLRDEMRFDPLFTMKQSILDYISEIKEVHC